MKTLIIDDEQLAQKNLEMLLNEYCPEINIIGFASGKNEAKEKINQLKPEVIFLDIRMPSGAEGFELLDEIENKDFFVVFVTAFKDYAVKAFNANAVHYILKPIDVDDLKSAVEKLMQAKKTFNDDPQNYVTYYKSLKNLAQSLTENKTDDKIVISHSRGLKIIDSKTIVHLEASGNCTTIYFEDGTRYLDTRTLKIYENILNPDFFFRTHKSHIINMNRLVEYVNEDGHYAVLNDNLKIPVARNRVSDFIKVVKNKK